MLPGANGSKIHEEKTNFILLLSLVIYSWNLNKKLIVSYLSPFCRGETAWLVQIRFDNI